MVLVLSLILILLLVALTVLVLTQQERGNSAFQEGDLDAASRLYTAAIEMVSELLPETEEYGLAHVLHSNRSAVWAAQVCVGP